MCSLSESNEAYQYIGLPGYNPHLSRDVFYEYLNQEEAKEKHPTGPLRLRTDHQKTLLINARRIFHIAEAGRTYKEREDLARCYFDQVMAVEVSTDGYRTGAL